MVQVKTLRFYIIHELGEKVQARVCTYRVSTSVPNVLQWREMG